MIKVLLIGNLGKDAEVKTFENGGRVVNFTVASTEKGYTTKDNRQIPDKTEWIDCVIKREAMMKVADYLKKGIKVYVEGKLESREYTKDDVKRKIFEVAVSEIQLLTPKGEGSGQSAQSATAAKDDDLPW
jgi:single-strand DNA-binding protein